MQSLPLMGAEVQRVRSAFASASVELQAVLGIVEDVGAAKIGTPACDDAVSGALASLRSILGRFEAQAQESVRVTSRHTMNEPEETVS